MELQLNVKFFQKIQNAGLATINKITNLPFFDNKDLKVLNNASYVENQLGIFPLEFCKELKNLTVCEKEPNWIKVPTSTKIILYEKKCFYKIFYNVLFVLNPNKGKGTITLINAAGEIISEDFDTKIYLNLNNTKKFFTNCGRELEKIEIGTFQVENITIDFRTKFNPSAPDIINLVTETKSPMNNTILYCVLAGTSFLVAIFFILFVFQLKKNTDEKKDEKNSEDNNETLNQIPSISSFTTLHLSDGVEKFGPRN